LSQEACVDAGIDLDRARVGGDPGKVQRREGAQQVAAIDGAQAIGEGEVVNDAGPGLGRKDEAFGRRKGKALQGEQGLGRKNERPQLLQIGVGETEVVGKTAHIAGDFCGACGSRQRGHGGRGGEGARSLPEGRLGFDVGKERTCDGGEEIVEGAFRGLRKGVALEADFAHAEAGDGSLAYGPKDGVVACGDGALSGRSSTVQHAPRENGVGRQGVMDVHREQGVGQRIDQGSGHQALFLAYGGTRNDEVGGLLVGGLQHAAHGVGGEPMVLRSENQRAARVELPGAGGRLDVIGGLQHPALAVVEVARRCPAEIRRELRRHGIAGDDDDLRP
jgi:hypothetical protein